MQNHLRRKCNQSICSAAEPVSPRRTKGASRREAAVPPVVPLTLAGRGGSVSRRDHSPAARNRAQLAWAYKSEGTHKPIPSHSSRESTSKALLAEKPPSPSPVVPLTSAGRGGSVSRRDHNPAAGHRVQLAWAHKPEGTHKPIPSHSSGEGVWGRGASLREAASPPASPPRLSSEGGPGEGLLFREAASPGVLPLLPSGLVAGAFAFVAFAVAAVVTRGNLDVSQSANVVGFVMLAAFHAAMDALTLVGHEGFLPVQSVARRGAEESIPRARACDTAQSMV